ncbi:HTTM domain-containing protein [Leptospira ilyithenensis]|uniref:HTTM-like domain-containing protein n=1 Tax=Leptospira ilyithenensis TaxID=2484901 RepID=A0A4R9LQ48_9LEPT|nr:HTTM domain-containing protein [Leptospira ilyithenensis]TGN10106.1 hypothetical protein EHS11_11135 [Leptospira ilyithenensis]
MTVISCILKEVPSHILIHFRIIYGTLGFVLVSRYLFNGWIEKYFLQPKVFFPHLVALNPLPYPWPYLHVFILLFLSLLICFGIKTRWALFFFLPLFFAFHFFDRTIFLNHYYLFLLFGFLLLLSPLHERNKKISFIWILIFRIQILIPYFFGGIAKLNPEWLQEGQPLHIWLSRSEDIRFIGELLVLRETGILVSWLACIFDLTIPFFLSLPYTRNITYLFALVFHLLTGLFFPLGMFPWMMPLLGLVLFSPETHEKVGNLFDNKLALCLSQKIVPVKSRLFQKIAILLCGILFLFEMFLANRHWFYPGNLFWTEEGFRFSWNIMVVEKAGYAEFWIQTDKNKIPVRPGDHLTDFQIRMMSYQPDMIEQFARYLKTDYIKKHPEMKDIQIYANIFVSVNGKTPKRLVNRNYDLAESITPMFQIPNFVLKNNYP